MPVTRSSKSITALIISLLLVPPGARAASVENIVEKYGLTGNWAPDCAKPPAPTNPHLVYRLLDPDRLQREIRIAPDKIFDVSVVLSMDEIAPGELRMAWKTGEGGITNRVRAQPGQMQVVDSTRDNGEKLFVDGRRVRDDAAALTYNKCP